MAGYPKQNEWETVLTPGQDFVPSAQLGGTEPPRSSPLLNEKRKGTFVCAGCKAPLFDSLVKFESGTGNWALIGHGLALVRDGACGSRRSQASPPSPWVRSFGAPIAAATSEMCSTTARPLEERPPLNPGYGLGYGTP